MIGYFITKATQVATFKIFRDQLIGVAEAQDPNTRKTKKYHKEKKISIFGRPLGMRYLTIGVCWDGFPVNVHTLMIGFNLIGS